MTMTGPTDEVPLDPVLSPGEREELTCLDYFLKELDRLRDRGLIPEASYRTVVDDAGARRRAIVARGRGQAALDAARRLARNDPRAAVAWAARAREADPARRQAWELELELRLTLRDDDGARALAAAGAERLGDFLTPDDVARRITERDRRAVADTVALAREALGRGDDARVIALCSPSLAAAPDHVDALVLTAFARQRRGELDEALGLYTRLARLQPDNAAWPRWVANVERRRDEGAPASRPADEARGVPAPVAPAPAPAPAPRGPSWQEVTGEFLQDHWQKLILCLAVLLIVVSSNVGAYQLLGPRLWSPTGKSVLALVYTAMFAGLGVGLARWGAERAGRIMLLTTLIVIPADFMLIGQMGLLARARPAGLALLGLDAAALFGLIRVVTSALRLPRGAGFLSAALFAIGACNAALPAPAWPWAAQFAGFLAPALVLLGAEVAITTRLFADRFPGRREATFLALGLLAFAAVSAMARAGALVLRLEPTLYAVPAMLLAAGCVHAAGRIERFEEDEGTDRRPESWLRFAGLVLTGFGFALALARPEGAVYSGSALTAALLGLAIYVGRLRRERHPVYIYLAFGALLVAYFGAYYFAKDLLQTVEQAASRALGYGRTLPLAFRSINGLVLSPVLAGFALFFRRSWDDARLARHCHYLGLPFALGACVLSAFEPKAAVICLTGYAALFTLAVAVFAAPAVTYLAAAALAGAVVFGATLWPATTLADQSLLVAVLGVGYWFVGLALGSRGVSEAYRRPLDHAALGMASLAAVLGTAAVLPFGPVAFPAAVAFVVVTFLLVLVNGDAPRVWLGLAAAVAGNVAVDLLALAAGARWSGGLTVVEFAAAAAGAGLLGVTVGSWLRGAVERGVEGTAWVYPAPLFQGALAQVALALALCALHGVRLADRLAPADFAGGAVALGLSAGALALLTRPYPRPALAHLAIACGLGVWVCLFQVANGGAFARCASYSALATGYALVLLALAESARVVAAWRKSADGDFRAQGPPASDLFSRALPGFEVAVVVGSAALGVYGGRNGPALVTTFALGAVALLWSTRLRPSARLVDLALALAVPAALCLTAWRVGWATPGITVAWLALTTAALAAALWAAGTASARRPALALYAAPGVRAAAILTWFVFPVAVAGNLVAWRAYPLSAAAFGVNAAVLALLAGTRRRPACTYRAVISTVVGVYAVILSVGTPRPETAYVPGLIAVLLALAAEAAGFVCRAWATSENARERVYARPLFVSAVVLTVLGVAPAYRSPGTMALVAVSFLLLVKGLPARQWLYGTVAALVCALYYGFLTDWPPSRLVTAAVVIGYQLWALGLLTRRAESALVRRLRLPDRGYDLPLFNSAAAACVASALLRVGETLDGARAWSDSAGLALNLAVFALAMIKAYPRTGWVHLAVGLASLSAGLAAYPRLTDPFAWLPLGMALAVGWLEAARLARRYEAALCRRFGIPPRDYAGPVALWSRGSFAVWATLTAALVGSVTVVALLGRGATPDPSRWQAWVGVLLALALGVAYTVRAWAAADRVAVAAGAGAQALLAVWWLGSPHSPLVARLGMVPAVYLPLATAAAAGVATVLGLRLTRRPGWRGAFWRAGAGDDTRARLDALAAQGGLALALLAAVMTRGQPGVTTAATLALATLAPAAAAIARGWVPAGYAAGASWVAAGVFAALEVARRAGAGSDADAGACVAAAAGALVALAALWAVAGGLRRGRPISAPGTAVALPAPGVAVALEQVAAVAAVLAGGAVAVSALGFGLERPGHAAGATAVGVLFGVGLFFVGLIVRWGADWLVYAAQAALLGGYLYFRWAFPVPAAADAAVLTLLGYLNLGLAEAMHRVGLGRFARPTLYVALAQPLLPLALAVGGGGLAGQRLFVTFAAATFYGVACYAMEWKALGYAAAVLYNACLWVLWGRIGWGLADHPQFFLVPVGLSAVLFAEVNRRSLGRSAVNAIRGVGLAVIYLALAVPFWQSASLGAWLALLLVSLAGIFVGIGLRVQLFLWFGLAGFVLDVVFQLGLVGLQHTLAKWAIMLALGILLVLFVALNEKKRIVATMRAYLDEARRWE